MPRVFRIMRKDPDGSPTVSQTSLGIRPGRDVDLDAQNNVLVNGKGMSVTGSWRDINVNRIPKRLRPIMPGAGGSNSTFCFRGERGLSARGPRPRSYPGAGLSNAWQRGSCSGRPSCEVRSRYRGNPTGLAGRRDIIMTPRPLTISPSYAAMVRGTRELHQFLAAGRDDSPEADALRDATDGPWTVPLSEVERNRIRHLSEDLYSLIEPPPTAQPLDTQAQAKLTEIFVARQRGEWDRALDLLRRWRAHFDPAWSAICEGSIWLEVGDPETAVLFFGHCLETPT